MARIWFYIAVSIAGAKTKCFFIRIMTLALPALNAVNPYVGHVMRWVI